MLDHMSEQYYRPHPKLSRALDILFILHADHELNCSTAAMRLNYNFQQKKIIY